MRLFFALLFGALVFLLPSAASAAVLPGFSQIKTRGEAAGDEFIELFNAGEIAFDLNGYKLVKETSSGTAYTLLTFGTQTIAPQSYLLLALDDSSFASQSDLVYKTALADDNKLLLLDPTKAVVDVLHWGTGAALQNHEASQSYQRLWQSVSATWAPWSAAEFTLAHKSGNLYTAPAPESEEAERTDPDPIVPPSIALHEIMLNPSSGDLAWIEIELNPLDLTSLSGAELFVDGIMFASLAGSVSGQPYLTISSTQSFSNEPHLVEIKFRDAVLASVAVPANLKRQAYARASGISWTWTDVSTSGRPNVITILPPAPACIQQSTSNETNTNPPPPDSTLPTSGRIRLNEVFANPSGDEATLEFIELYNEEPFAVSLDGWTIADAAKTTSLQGIVIQGHTYKILRRSDTGLSLNNSAETVTLTSPAGYSAAMTYTAAAEDKSWNIAAEGWYEAHPTPGSVNTAPTMESQLPSADEEASPAISLEQTPQEAPEHDESEGDPIPSLNTRLAEATSKAAVPSVTAAAKKERQVTFKEWSKVKANERIMMLGLISVPPGIFGDKVAVMQDFGPGWPGVELYFSKADWPELEEGDVVAVIGKKSQAKQGDRLLISASTDIEVIDHTTIDAQPINIGELSPKQHRTLVAIDARLVQQKKESLIFADDSYEISANTKKAGFMLEPADLPAKATVIGLFINGSKPELWLRSEDDIEFATEVAVEHPVTLLASYSDIPTTVIESKPAEAGAPWVAPLAAASSAGGLTWYFFQDALRQQASKLWQRLGPIKH